MSNDAQPSRSVISSEVEILGTVKTSGSIQVEGRIEGEIISQGDVVIGKSGSVKGNLHVKSITLAGTVQGNIQAKDRIELKSTARLLGDIKAKRLAVEDGVTFVGKSEVNPTGQPIKLEEPAKEQPQQGGEQGQQGQQQNPRK